MLLTFKNLNRFLVLSFAALILAACTTTPQDTASTSSSSSASKVEVVDGVYVGTDTVEMLAVDVPDRVFFAYDSYSLTSAAQATLAKQAKWLKANGSVTIAIEGHADERGTREYNLALGERRANAVKDYLMSQGVASSKITVISYGKERPVNPESSRLAWSQNRRSVTVKSK